MVRDSGITPVLRGNLLIWGPNACVIASLTSFLYIGTCICIYMSVYIYAH